MVQVEIGAGTAVVALDAADLVAVAVDLRDGRRPGPLVQVVDVLSDHVLHVAHALEIGKRQVGGVGHGVAQRLGKLGQAALALKLALPPAHRVLDEALEAAVVGLAVLLPEPTLAAIGGDARLRADPGAHERNGMPGAAEQPGGRPDGRISGDGFRD